MRNVAGHQRTQPSTAKDQSGTVACCQADRFILPHTGFVGLPQEEAEQLQVARRSGNSERPDPLPMPLRTYAGSNSMYVQLRTWQNHCTVVRLLCETGAAIYN